MYDYNFLISDIFWLHKGVGAAPPLNYRLALWTDLAVGANGPPIH